MFTLSAYACFILLLVFIPSNGCLAPLFPVRSAGDAPSWVERDGGTEANRGEFVSLERKVNTRMARRRIPQGPQLNRVLARAHELAEQVRETAERVHQEAQEARRLIQIARQQAERGWELSRAGREEARAAVASIKWSIDIAGNGKRRASGRDGN